jgi:thymidylate kinase
MRVDFCGIDGCGKSSVIARLMDDPRLAGRRPRVAKCDVKDNRSRLLDSGRYRDRSAFVEGVDAELYALASAFDYLAYSRTPAAAPGAGELQLRDRSHHCFIAYCLSVSPACGALGAALLEPLPDARKTFWIRADPRLCMDRIDRRDGGRPFDESVPLLERFDAAYGLLFAGRRDVHIVFNEDLDRAVDRCAEILLAA